MDAEDYSKMPLSQWEEDNVLRELNKCLLAFQQTPMKSKENARQERRLSPIGKFWIHLHSYCKEVKFVSSYVCL